MPDFSQSVPDEFLVPTNGDSLTLLEIAGPQSDTRSGQYRHLIIDGLRASSVLFATVGHSIFRRPDTRASSLPEIPTRANVRAVWRSCTILGFFALSLAYAVYIIVSEPLDRSDFRYVWLAGELWSKGVGPYSRTFVDSAENYVPVATAPMTFWVYPPHWEWIAVALSLLSPFAAFKVWITAELAMVAGGGYLLWKAAGRPANGMFLLAAALSSTCVVWGVRTGQPTIVAAFGVCVIIYALAYESTPLLVAGIVLAALKPSVGAPFIIGLLFMRNGTKALAIAVLVLTVLSIPSLLADTALDILRGVTGSSYDAVAYNQPRAMNGLAHALVAFRFHISTVTSLALAIGVSCALLWKRRTPRDYLRACAACTAFFVTLHPYDMTVLFLLLPFAPEWSLLLALAIAWRAENIAKLVGHSSATLMTVSAAIALAGVVSSSWKSRSASSQMPALG